MLGFRDDIYPKEIKDILIELMKTTSLDNLIFVEDILPKIRTLFPCICFEMFYEANISCGDGFVNIDDFENKVGISFIQHLKNQNR